MVLLADAKTPPTTAAPTTTPVATPPASGSQYGSYTPPAGYGGSNTPAPGTNGTLNVAPTSIDLYGTGMNANEAYDPVTVGGTKSTISQQMARLGALAGDPASILAVQQQLYHAGYLTDVPTGTLDTKTYTAYLTALREANRGGKDFTVLIATKTDQLDRLGGPTAKPGASPRSLGLGKYAIDLSNPDDVLTAADSMAQTLVGRRATKEEVAKLVTDLQSKEKAGKGAANEAYMSQQMAYYEALHGGVVQPGAQAAAAQGASAAAATPPTPISNALGGGLSGGPLTGGPITPNEPPTSTPGSVNAGPDNPGPAPSPTQPGAPPTPGAVTLADGTVLSPPQQITYTGAPSAASEAYAMYANTPEMQAYAVAKAYAALDNFIKAK